MQNQEKEEGSRTLPASPQAEEEGSARRTERFEAELARARDQAVRAVADLENYRKRFERELERLREFDRDRLFRDLLPVVDNLERALAGAHPGEPISRAGVEAVYRQILGALKRHGVEPMEDKGQPFDAARHEVVGTAQTGAPEGTVTDVAERGYRVGDRPLRPARVIVENPGSGA